MDNRVCHRACYRVASRHQDIVVYLKLPSGKPKIQKTYCSAIQNGIKRNVIRETRGGGVQSRTRQMQNLCCRPLLSTKKKRSLKGIWFEDSPEKCLMNSGCCTARAREGESRKKKVFPGGRKIESTYGATGPDSSESGRLA